MADLIPSIKLPYGHTFQFGEDTARYTLDPGDEFHRPSIAIPNGAKFVWPVGTEGFRYSSNAALGIHRYIGDDEIEVSVIYRDEPHIELSGVFPGHTAATHMHNLREILEAKTPDNGKLLSLPHLFPRIQYVAAESWDFTHDPEDRTRSVAYTISFLKIGVGRRILAPKPDEPDQNPVPDAQPGRYFIVKDKYRTLRSISKKVYRDEKKWHRIHSLNKKKLDKYFKTNHIPNYKYPWHKLPLGMKLKY